MKISIAMATYNGACFLPEQLASFSLQTRLPDELIICDDGSTDNSLQILGGFERTAPFVVRIWRNEQNLGLIQNFERAMSFCSGDIIFLSDQDDIWFKDKISVVCDSFEANRDALVMINDMYIGNARAEHRGVTQLGNIRATNFGDDRFVAGCCLAMRREFLQGALPIPHEQFAHDAWISEISVALGVRRLIDQPLQIYRRHRSNASQWLLSDPAGVSQFRMMRENGLMSPRSRWIELLKRQEVMLDRLPSICAKLEKVIDKSCYESACEKIVFSRCRYINRLRTLDHPRILRWFYVLRNWIYGEYRYFSGWKSAFKDMIRP